MYSFILKTIWQQPKSTKILGFRLYEGQDKDTYLITISFFFTDFYQYIANMQYCISFGCTP